MATEVKQARYLEHYMSTNTLHSRSTQKVQKSFYFSLNLLAKLAT